MLLYDKRKGLALLKSQHTFELPLYLGVSNYFRGFLADLGNPIELECEVTFWKEKLTFFSRFQGSDGRKASITPFPRTFSDERQKQALTLTSVFASKFNATMSVCSRGGVDVSISLIHGPFSEEERKIYGDDLVVLLIVNVTCKSLAADLALTNFFTVIDCSHL